ncbi:PP2C family protein-serine/threonine phosphatase [Pseudobutyrivibrio xylanivorans]|uniref:Sigma-B regulation protein RsbU (Phosphoserine phosphatase) n=1 Tax=Pseudobutyrivibrio xylanivorans DSM 14809 TaxID=1123012 RepID=A0A1M6BCW9_PSEXY|nr:PP2C family protein-serine/threonine phosphatase [Pseudobutyrivibrio xylanivorans]SHI46303.1 sigma-B regulation protein RsbU (phosphoserine phosphatase) [Pseudobutyrivibrio xylanivorans DSM 14809]
MTTIFKKKKFGIHAKALAGIIVFTLLINIAMCISGSLVFDRSVQKIYNERGYVVANIILHHIDHDKIAEYTKTWYEDDYYQDMVEYLKSVQEFSNAAYIYIGVPREDHTIQYIYDSGSNMGFVDPIAASFDELWKVYTEGVKPNSYLVRHSQYGYLTSSCLPVEDSKGNVVALLFVDTNMEVIHSTLRRFIIAMIIIAIVLLGAFCFLNWHYMNTYIIHPLIVLTKNIKHFADETTTDDSLNNIKTGDELEELAKSVYSMEQDIVEYIDNIETITAEKERITAELNVAAKIQADMLPRIFPPFPERKEFDIYATMTPAKEVGGDFYDFFLVDNDHLALVMADVSGKGVPAALFMVNAKTLIKYRALMDKVFSPSDILYDVNNQLCEGNDADLFVTVWLGIIEISTGKVIAANAGHEHPVIKRADGKFELDIYKHSPAVAAMEGIKFRENEFQLNHGDCLFVYTDGVPEATNSQNERYGAERMLTALNLNPNANMKELLEIVENDIDIFVEDSPQFDDITMLSFKYL